MLKDPFCYDLYYCIHKHFHVSLSSFFHTSLPPWLSVSHFPSSFRSVPFRSLFARNFPRRAVSLFLVHLRRADLQSFVFRSSPCVPFPLHFVGGLPGFSIFPFLRFCVFSVFSRRFRPHSSFSSILVVFILSGRFHPHSSVSSLAMGFIFAPRSHP